jgi:hypothetical protein
LHRVYGFKLGKTMGEGVSGGGNSLCKDPMSKISQNAQEPERRPVGQECRVLLFIGHVQSWFK